MWDLELEASLAVPDADVAGCGSPFPTLVTVGIGDGRTLLVDLEQQRICRIGGEATHVRALLRHIAAELATSTIAEDVETLLVGFGDTADVLNPDRIVVEPDLMTALGELERRAITTRMELSRLQLATTVEGRLHNNAASSWLPTVLLVGQVPTPKRTNASTELLDESTAGATGVAVVVFDPAEPHVRIGDDGVLSLDLPVGDDWQAAQLPDDEGDQLADLLGTTDDPAVPAGPADGDEPWSTGMNEDGSLGAAGADVDERTHATRSPGTPTSS